MRLERFCLVVLSGCFFAVGLIPVDGEIIDTRVLPNNEFEIIFSSKNGLTYEILRSDDLKKFSAHKRILAKGDLTKVNIGSVPVGQKEGFFKVSTKNLPPLTEWKKSYSGSYEESHGHYIIACSDGGFLQVGETGFLPSTRILAVKVNGSGKLEWKKEYSNKDTGSSQHGRYNLGNSVIETDAGYLLAGSINRNSALLMLNKKTGDVVYVKTHNNGGYDSYEHLAINGDKIIAVGYTNSEDINNTFFAEGKGYVSFADLEGDKMNGKIFGGDLAQAYRIARVGEEFIVSGLSWSENDDLDYAVLRIDGSGKEVWRKTFGGSGEDHCFGMDLGKDGSIFLTGHTLSGTKNWQTYTMKISSAGIVDWENKIGNPRGFNPRYIHDEAWGIRATPDGGCIITAGTGDEYSSYSERIGSESSDRWKAYVIKFDRLGKVEWQDTYGQLGSDWAGEDLALTKDGGVVIAVDDGGFGFLKLSEY